MGTKITTGNDALQVNQNRLENIFRPVSDKSISFCQNLLG